MKLFKILDYALILYSIISTAIRKKRERKNTIILQGEKAKGISKTCNFHIMEDNTGYNEKINDDNGDNINRN